MDEHFDDVIGKLFDQALAPLVTDAKLLGGLRSLLREGFYAGAWVIMHGGCSTSDGMEERAFQKRLREIEVTAHLYANRETAFPQSFGPVQ